MNSKELISQLQQVVDEPVQDILTGFQRLQGQHFSTLPALLMETVRVFRQISRMPPVSGYEALGLGIAALNANEPDGYNHCVLDFDAIKEMDSFDDLIERVYFQLADTLRAQRVESFLIFHVKSLSCGERIELLEQFQKEYGRLFPEQFTRTPPYMLVDDLPELLRQIAMSEIGFATFDRPRNPVQDF